MKAADECQRREECARAIAAAYRKTSDALDRNADVLTAFGLAGLSALGFVVLMRKPDVSQPTDEAQA